jgi:starch synthase
MKKRVLFVTQEITPFLPETEISITSRNLPQKIQESGKEIRIFMPRFGCVNERRHQLHEVIRLSGMNLVVDDHDHPLIIKVASIPQARMQVYFIDNEEYFKRKAFLTKENGKLFKDSDERAIFFAKGVLETAKKLGWKPDIIHCHGWMSSMVPLYIKTIFADDPHFKDTKIIYSIYNQNYSEKINKKVLGKLAFDGIDEENYKCLNKANLDGMIEMAINNSDALVVASDDIDKEIKQYIEDANVPVLEKPDDEDIKKVYSEFYDKILESVAVDS